MGQELTKASQVFSSALVAQRVASRHVRASKFDPRIVEQIAKLTQRNDHRGALALGAKMLGFKRTEKKVLLLKELAELESNSTHYLVKYQDQLYEEVMRYAKQALSDDEYEQFHGSY